MLSLMLSIKDHSRAVVGFLLKVCPTSESSHSCHSIYLSNANFIFECDVSHLSRVLFVLLEGSLSDLVQCDVTLKCDLVAVRPMKGPNM